MNGVDSQTVRPSACLASASFCNISGQTFFFCACGNTFLKSQRKAEWIYDFHIQIFIL